MKEFIPLAGESDYPGVVKGRSYIVAMQCIVFAAKTTMNCEHNLLSQITNTVMAINRPQREGQLSYWFLLCQ